MNHSWLDNTCIRCGIKRLVFNNGVIIYLNNGINLGAARPECYYKNENMENNRDSQRTTEDLISEKMVIKQWLVSENSNIELLYQTGKGFFKTTHGAFGQRDMYIERIDEKSAKKLIDEP